jgi:hypothetical protein
MEPSECRTEAVRQCSLIRAIGVLNCGDGTVEEHDRLAEIAVVIARLADSVVA